MAQSISTFCVSMENLVSSTHIKFWTLQDGPVISVLGSGNRGSQGQWTILLAKLKVSVYIERRYIQKEIS